ncbi:uncharacterized protein LOC144139911 [Haemaphysalis longicornis]
MWQKERCTNTNGVTAMYVFILEQNGEVSLKAATGKRFSHLGKTPVHVAVLPEAGNKFDIPERQNFLETNVDSGHPSYKLRWKRCDARTPTSSRLQESPDGGIMVCSTKTRKNCDIV